MEKEMATHSSILAWKIQRTEEPDGLQSMGSQRVGHDRSNLAYTEKSECWWLLITHFFMYSPRLDITTPYQSSHIRVQVVAIKENVHTPLACIKKKKIKLVSKIAQGSSSCFRLLQTFLSSYWQVLWNLAVIIFSFKNS